MESDELAIIGMAGRFPGAADLPQFWNNLRLGVESIRSFTDEELLANGVRKAALNSPNFVRAGALLEDVDLFAASFFGMSPRDAELMDPQHRIFLECAWHALENAGYVSETFPGLVGVYAGTSLSSYLLFNLLETSAIREVQDTFPIMVGNDKDFLSTRVSYHLNLRGPSLDIQTGCSTSLVALHLACEALLSCQCDLALAGGVSINVPQKTGYFYHSGGVTSPDGHCRAFDARAQGTVFGSGVGIVVLKRLDDAIADGDTIYAVVKGSAINNDGSAKVGYTAPSVDGQAEVVARAQAIAGVSAASISYVETHGTGTPLGDPVEVQALTKAFRVGSGENQFCALGSVKANIGHLDAAAGVAGLIKTTLALHHRQIPPMSYFEEPNPQIEFASTPFYVNGKLIDWHSQHLPRRAGVSSFGIGGTNAHVVLEEAPAVQASPPPAIPQVLVLSAKSATALSAMAANLAEHLRRFPDENLADIAYTLQLGRKQFRHRMVLVCSNLQDAMRALESESDQVLRGAPQLENRSVAFLIPAVNAQPIDKGRGLYQHEPVFRDHVDRCCALLAPLLKLDLRTVLYPGVHERGTAEAMLIRSGVAQAATFVIEYALAQLWTAYGIRPDVVIGDGIGEYVAKCLAGVLGLEDALTLAIAQSPASDSSTADFNHRLKALASEAPRVLLEVGPGQMLSDLVRQNALRPPDQAVLASLGGATDGEQDTAHLLSTLGRLWIAGVDINWQALHPENGRRRVPLPGYPFERERYWIEPELRSPAPSESSARAASDWFYTPVWKRPLPLLRSCQDAVCHLLLFDDGSQLSAEVANGLRTLGHRVTRVLAAQEFSALADDSFQIDAAAPEHYVRLLDGLSGAACFPTRLLHMWNAHVAPPGQGFETRFTTAQKLGLYSLLYFARASARRFASPLRISVVAPGLHDVTGEESLFPEHATLLAACNVLPQEFPHLSCHLLDVTPDRLALAAGIIEEFMDPDPPPLAALRNGGRWLLSYEPLPLQSAPPAPAPLRDGGVYMIVGGLGAIGLALSEHLGARVGARLVLVRRSSFPARAEWNAWLESHPQGDSISKIIRRLQALQAAGAQVLVLSAELSDRQQMQAVLGRVHQEFGALHGVFHAAGYSGKDVFKPIPELHTAEFERQFRSKVHGLRVLDDVLGEYDLDFRVLFSSNASVLGGPGLLAYAAAHRFMDAFASARKRPTNRSWTTVNWDPWLASTDAAVFTRSSGIERHSITCEEGGEALRRILSQIYSGQVVVSTSDLQSRIKQWIEDPQASLTPDDLASEPLHARPPLDVSYVAPRNEIEETVIQIWQELLGIDEIGVHDNFFELGGTSLNGAKIIDRINEALGLELPIVKLFDEPTVSALVKSITREDDRHSSYKKRQDRGERRREIRLQRGQVGETV